MSSRLFKILRTKYGLAYHVSASFNLYQELGEFSISGGVESKGFLTRNMDKTKGPIVIGLPSNQFGGQEPGSNSEIKNFCEVNFNVNFPLTTKIDVKGENINSIYKWALENYGKKASPKWNFYKILINKEGKIEKTYSSITNPMSKKITSEIEKLLNIE